MSDQNIPEGMPPVGLRLACSQRLRSGALDIALVLPAPVAALMLDAAMASQAGPLVNGPWRLDGLRSVETDPPAVMAVLNCTPDSFSDGGPLCRGGRG